MTRKGCIWGWLIGIVALLVIFLVTVIAIEALLGETISFPAYGARVALVRVQGVLAGGRLVLDELDTMSSTPGIRALVLRVDSPGGGASASQEIYEKVVEIRDTGLPVIVSMGSVAASGGYYVACPADSILANPASITGSIGVRMSFTNLEELFAKIGVDFETVKSGEFKDTGAWDRPLTPEERELLQGTVDDIHNQFVETIALERDMPIDEVRAIADGRIFSGRQALDAGLIDALGTLDDAIRVAGRMGGIEGEPRVQEPVRRERLTLGDILRGSLAGALGPMASNPEAQYLYEPPK
jgi:protease-4